MGIYNPGRIGQFKLLNPAPVQPDFDPSSFCPQPTDYHNTYMVKNPWSPGEVPNGYLAEAQANIRTCIENAKREMALQIWYCNVFGFDINLDAFFDPDTGLLLEDYPMWYDVYGLLTTTLGKIHEAALTLSELFSPDYGDLREAMLDGTIEFGFFGDAIVEQVNASNRSQFTIEQAGLIVDPTWQTEGMIPLYGGQGGGGMYYWIGAPLFTVTDDTIRRLCGVIPGPDGSRKYNPFALYWLIANGVIYQIGQGSVLGKGPNAGPYAPSHGIVGKDGKLYPSDPSPLDFIQNLGMAGMSQDQFNQAVALGKQFAKTKQDAFLNEVHQALAPLGNVLSAAKSFVNAINSVAPYVKGAVIGFKIEEVIAGAATIAVAAPAAAGAITAGVGATAGSTVAASSIAVAAANAGGAAAATIGVDEITGQPVNVKGTLAAAATAGLVNPALNDVKSTVTGAAEGLVGTQGGGLNNMFGIDINTSAIENAVSSTLGGSDIGSSVQDAVDTVGQFVSVTNVPNPATPSPTTSAAKPVVPPAAAAGGGGLLLIAAAAAAYFYFK